MKIKLTTVHVDDQDKALRFYTEVLGFAKIAKLHDTCGNLIQLTQLARW
jgi:catechol 2,3-dioxygenase-like lactoylglutathione lyase family enzyme